MVHFIAVVWLETCASNMMVYGVPADQCYDVSELIPATLIPA